MLFMSIQLVCLVSMDYVNICKPVYAYSDDSAFSALNITNK